MIDAFKNEPVGAVLFSYTKTADGVISSPTSWDDGSAGAVVSMVMTSARMHFLQAADDAADAKKRACFEAAARVLSTTHDLVFAAEALRSSDEAKVTS